MSDTFQMGANVQIEDKKGSLEEALVRCAKENGVAGGMTIPMIHFRQGTRHFFEGVLPITFITKHILRINLFAGSSAFRRVVPELRTTRKGRTVFGKQRVNRCIRNLPSL
jgi:hypothetical protein